MKNYKRAVCLLLTSAFVLASVGCGKSDEAEKVSENNREEIKDDFWLPKDLRFDGETFDLYIAIPTASQSFIAPEETGHHITDAVYQRNKLVEDRLGVKLNFVGTAKTSSGEDQNHESSLIRTLIQGGAFRCRFYSSLNPNIT